MKPYTIVMLLLLSFSATAGETKIYLKDAPGKDVVESNCAACHSLDYILMNSGFLDAKGWEATVKKMVGSLGAPVPAEAIPRIIEYLARNYGK
jgi:sulfite dehydrogenase (cytochrome) subunit B